MAEIHILPASCPGADQIGRLSADPSAAQERGADLGSRVAHIHANGWTDEEASELLQIVHRRHEPPDRGNPTVPKT